MGSRLESNSTAVRKRIEGHAFDNEEGEEYEPSKFGGFPDYFRRKKIKLQNLDTQIRAENEEKPQIFRGIVAHVNGYTQPSLNDLHVLIVSHGGGFMQYLDGKTQVTHIIASNLTPKKVEEFRKYRIIKPAWIVDSVNAGKLLSWENYRVVDEGTKQKVLKFDEGQIKSQVNRKAVGYRDQTDTSWYTKQLAQQSSTPVNDLGDGFDDDLDFSRPALLSDNAKTGSKSSSASTAHAERDSAQHESSHGDAGSQSNQAYVSDSRPSEARDQSDAAAGSDLSHLETAPSDPPEESFVMQNQRGASDLYKASVYDLEKPYDEIPNPLKRVHSEHALAPEKRARMTPEDHNRELLSDPRIRKSSVLNPDFLEQYYRESRLHHLSTWKADLKSQLQALTAEKTASQKAKNKRASNARRYILHVDFDSFFVAVSLKNHPHLQDKPAVVAHGAGSGSEIASCNYAARKYGVKNGMWMKRAQELCDDLKVLPYDFPAYEAASRLFYDAIIQTEGTVQSVSIDEALVDVSVQCHAAGGTEGVGVREGSVWREQAKADEIAQALRDRVKRESGCAVSVGIGGNILLAKVALRKAKPAGQHQIKPEDVLGFIGELEVQSLPGVAYSIGGKLEDIGVKYVKDIRELNRERLVCVLGPKTGDKIWNYARGIDRTEVGDQVVRKSVSAEVNWGVRFETQEQAEEFMVSLSGELSRRLLKEGVKGRNLTMKVMRRARDAPMDPPKHLGHGKCDVYNKSVVLGILTNDEDMISKETVSILRGFGFSPGELRGLGIQMTKLEPMKAPVAGLRDGSQRRLDFAAPSKTTTKSPMNRVEQAEVRHENAGRLHEDETKQAQLPDEETKPVAHESAKPGSQYRLPVARDRSAAPDVSVADDIQDDPETPKRPKSHFASGIPQMAEDSPSKKPLNVMGTQFVLPTQVDPQALTELPADIRAKLSKHVAKGKKQQPLNLPRDTQPESSARRPFAFTALPSESQIDPSILQALPEDVRNEILSQLHRSPSKPHAARGQAVLPQSPRKNRTVKANMASRGKTRGRPRGGSLLARLKGASSRSNSTLTQANFVAGQTDSESEVAQGELNQEFLEALPEDMRNELLENHKREQLKRTGGIEVARRRRQQQPRKAEENADGERTLRLDPRAAKPTFTQLKLSTLSELRETISSWFEEFDADGPYQEDVEALAKYLRSVVLDEGDMRKAVEIVKWLAHVVESSASPVARTQTQIQSSRVGSWAKTLQHVKDAVNESVRLRGLGAVDFDD